MTEPNEAIELVNCEDSEVLLFENHTCLVGRLKNEIKNWLEEYSQNLITRLGALHNTTVFNAKPNQFEWFKTGKESKLLKLGGQNWQSGKLRIKVTLEFCPDVSEEENIEINEIKQLEDSLDDLRQKLQ